MRKKKILATGLLLFFIIIFLISIFIENWEKKRVKETFIIEDIPSFTINEYANTLPELQTPNSAELSFLPYSGFGEIPNIQYKLSNKQYIAINSYVSRNKALLKEISELKIRKKKIPFTDKKFYYQYLLKEINYMRFYSEIIEKYISEKQYDLAWEALLNLWFLPEKWIFQNRMIDNYMYLSNTKMAFSVTNRFITSDHLSKKQKEILIKLITEREKKLTLTFENSLKSEIIYYYWSLKNANILYPEACLEYWLSIGDKQGIIVKGSHLYLGKSHILAFSLLKNMKYLNDFFQAPDYKQKSLFLSDFYKGISNYQTAANYFADLLTDFKKVSNCIVSLHSLSSKLASRDYNKTEENTAKCSNLKIKE